MPKGKQTTLSKAQQNFIRKNRMKFSGSDMAARLGVGKTVVTRFLRREGLQVPMETIAELRSKKMTGRTSSDKRTDAFLKRNYLKMPSKTMADKLGRSDSFIRCRLRQLGLVIPKEVISRNTQLARFKPGHTPANKGKAMSKEVYKKLKATMFKKGQLPPNTYDRDGVITIRHDKTGKPYKYIRISPGVWVPYHRYRWEMFRGAIPKGLCLAFKDGNTLNTKLNNLELITRQENMRRNTIARFPAEVRTAILFISKLNKKIQQCETKLETSQITSSSKSRGSMTKTSRAKSSRLK